MPQLNAVGDLENIIINLNKVIMEHKNLNTPQTDNSDLGAVSERLYAMQLHEEWIVGVPQGNQAQLTICRVPSGWIYNYRTGNGQLTSTFVPFDNRFQNAR